MSLSIERRQPADLNEDSKIRGRRNVKHSRQAEIKHEQVSEAETW